MAVAFTSTLVNVEGARRRVVGTLAFDSSYPTGGESVPRSLLGLLKFDDVRIGPKAGYLFEWDDTNQKVKVYQGDNDNAADAPLIEVADTTDLSALTAVPISALGY